MAKSKNPHRTLAEKNFLRGFGENVKRIRERRGYTQEEFAHLAGFSRSYYTEIETGKRNISLLNLIKIMKVLEVNANELLDFSEPKKNV